MALGITAIYASALTLIVFVLAQLVIRARGKTNIPLGDGGDARLLEASRRQMNFVENVPMTVILMMIAEAGGASAMQLHIAGVVLVLARIIHPFGIQIDRAAHPMRIGGAVATNLVQFGLIAILIMQRFS
jgi:uncharacterized protein